MRSFFSPPVLFTLQILGVLWACVYLVFAIQDNTIYPLFLTVTISIIGSIFIFFIIVRYFFETQKYINKILKEDKNFLYSWIYFNKNIKNLCNNFLEIKNLKNDLKKQISMYQSLFDGVPCLVTVQDRELRLIRYNKMFDDQFGAKPIEHCYKIYKGRKNKCSVCPVEKTFQDGKPHTTEEKGFYKDGRQAYWIVKTAPIYNENREIIAVMEMCLDITQRKELEKKLKKSEKKYSAIFESIPVAFFEMNRDFIIRNCNRMASKIYGYSKGEIIGMSFCDFFSENLDREEIKNILQKKQIERATHRNKDGIDFFVSIDLNTTITQDEEFFIAVVTDITNRIQAEQQLVQASKMTTLGEMAAGIAHELNQPLTVLKMIASYFVRKIEREQIPKPEEIRSMTDKMIYNVERASKIIDHMRQFGRKPQVKSEKIFVNDVILRASEFFEEQLRIRNISLLLELEHQQQPVFADPHRLEQVFINLLLNARDAIEDHAQVHPDASEARITLRTRSNSRYVVTEVVDTGMGIPSNILPRIFEPFFSTKAVGRGTGLGLSICYDIVTDYGGTIRAFSQPGCGARFVITLPIAGTKLQDNDPTEKPGQLL
ncbi:MAG: sensor signal transduction histidine kinase [Desulfomicrobiaceae bacterium]|nr:sensor signal transduction histidine kinase [Desulfomicrobiaceae bacterium]